MLFPFAPHVSADAYELLTGERVWEQPWPEAEEALLEHEEYELVCQVNGKRARPRDGAQRRRRRASCSRSAWRPRTS